MQFSELEKLSDLDLDLDTHVWSRSTHTPN